MITVYYPLIAPVMSAVCTSVLSAEQVSSICLRFVIPSQEKARDYQIQAAYWPQDVTKS